MKTHDFTLAACDTDSISFSNKGKPFTEKDKKRLLAELNGLMREGIVWTDDGVFKKLICVAAKNYIMVSEDGKVKIKGSGLKATKKEPMLKKFTTDVIDLLVNDKVDQLPSLYLKYAKEIMNINELTDINEWAFKVTVTKKVLEPTTPFNKKVLQALIDNNIEPIEGDKHYMFFKPVSQIKTVKNKAGKDVKKAIQDLEVCQAFNGDICKKTLLKKLFATAKTFKMVIDINTIPNLTLKKNQQQLNDITRLKAPNSSKVQRKA